MTTTAKPSNAVSLQTRFARINTTSPCYPLFYIAKIGTGNLYAAAKPPATELNTACSELHTQKISTVLSLLQPEEATALHLQTEAQACTALDIAFDSFPIPDFGVPPIDALTNLINRYHQHLHNGANTVVHCRGGIGRTGTICCCLLVRDGMNVTQAIDLVTVQRGVTVPETAEQIAVIKRFASGCHR